MICPEFLAIPFHGGQDSNVVKNVSSPFSLFFNTLNDRPARMTLPLLSHKKVQIFQPSLLEHHFSHIKPFFYSGINTT